MFLILSTQLVVLTSIQWSKSVNSALQQPKKTMSYGNGKYGTGEYPGYKSYLPIVNQGSK
jgi:hypothetical protein